MTTTPNRFAYRLQGHIPEMGLTNGDYLVMKQAERFANAGNEKGNFVVVGQLVQLLVLLVMG